VRVNEVLLVAIPAFEDIILPLLRFLKDGKSHSMKEAEEYLSNFFNLSKEERNQMKPSGNETIFHNRLHWAKFYLKKAHLLDSPPRSNFKITPRGLSVLKENLEKIDTKYLMRFPEFADFVQDKRK